MKIILLILVSSIVMMGCESTVMCKPSNFIIEQQRQSTEK